MVEIIGYILAMIIGVSLGLIGSGGSILTVPLLVYFFGLDAVLATAYSLFIVGVSSAIGATRFIIRKQTDLYVAALFAVPSLVAVYLVRRYLVPSLPAELFTLGDISVSRDTFILVFFALIMLLAATRMIRSGKTEVPAGSESRKPNILLVVVEGLIVGSVTGFVGAGGGFLIIPALVLLVGLPMKKAVATSLLIIAVKSLFGFIGDVQSHAIDWTFLITLAALASAGIYLGMYLGKKVDGSRLKKGFGYFVLLMALFMIIRESGIV